jgi:cardiolipin synthase
VKHVPNSLTAVRILATPIVFWLVSRRAYTPAIVLFIAIGLTDVADGVIARRFHASSRLGAYLDPIADKFLLSGMFVTLFLAHLIDPWLALVVLGRDALILVSAGVLYLAKLLRDFPPSKWGKISTLAQILFVCFRIGELDGIHVHAVVTGLKGAVGALAIVSTVDYARRMRLSGPGGQPGPHN